ncbi:MAG: cytochrome C [Gammaproteobacteria bacterium]|nr:cytochrome C [Gammaproteobacteria bacterium]
MWPTTALAVPSYARQTGMSCAACHTVPPQLTAFGRYFKLHGYVLGPDKLSGGSNKLNIDKFPPLSAMMLLSDTVTRTSQPGAQNSSVAFPQQLSFFYAGAIAEHMGAFAQITYTSDTDHFSMDNTDIRYARDANWGDNSVVWGLTANNDPSVQDVWNSTSDWGFPFLGSAAANTPFAEPVMVSSFNQQVAGLGAYVWLNNSIYGEVTLYRSSQIGVAQPYTGTASNIISGLAPYWRLAYEHAWEGAGGSQNDWEFGALGMVSHIFPGGGNALSGPTNDFNDVGVDTQYQRVMGADSLTLHGIYIHENQNWNAGTILGTASNPTDHLNYWKADASYYWNNSYGPTLAYFNTTGSTDPLLYGPVSALGSPNSNGWILQWTWVPALNVQASVQYVLYNKFNGASTNYDGTGRNASDNNTLYLALWLLW